jgi:hypothetical protein
MYPQTKNRFEKNLIDLDQSPLDGDHRLETLKERFLIVYMMLRAHPEAPDDIRKHIVDMLSTGNDLKGAEKALVDAKNALVDAETGQIAAVVSMAAAAYSLIVRSGSSLYDDSKAEARRTSSGDFLANLPTLLVGEPILADAAEQIYLHFTPKFRQRLHLLASEWAHYVAHIELEAVKNHCHREAAALEDQDRLKSRAELLRDLQEALVRDGSSRQVSIASLCRGV